MKTKLLLSVFGTLACTSLFSQWNSDPAINTPVAIAPHTQQNAYIVTDSKKGAIMVWDDYRNNPLKSDIYAQRLNAAGISMWTANGVPICNDTARQGSVVIVDAGNGSAIIAWEDLRNGTKDIYAQKIDSSGNILWTPNGVAICIKPLDQKKPAITTDTKGGAIIVWDDSSAVNSLEVFANRINASGTLMWGTGGVSVCSLVDKQYNSKVRPDGNGGAIICWQDLRFGLEYKIYAQRLDSIGDTQWATNGIPVCQNQGVQTSPKMREDGQGGAYIGWQDRRSGTYDIYAQRLDANGSLMWNLNALPVCNYLGNQSGLDMAADGINGVIISWKDDRHLPAPLEIYANRMSPAGVPLWGAYGLQMATGLNPNIVGDNSGGAIITWQDSVNAGGTWNVYAQRLDSAGTKLWLATGAPVAIANGGQSYPKHVSTGDGGAIFCWQDKRNTTDHDIYAHHLFPNGSPIGNIGIDELNGQNNKIVCFPNPFSSQCTIAINSSQKINSWLLNIYDINGKLVRTETVSNSNELTVNKKELESGLYFYQGINKTEIIGSGKFIIIN